MYDQNVKMHAKAFKQIIIHSKKNNNTWHNKKTITKLSPRVPSGVAILSHPLESSTSWRHFLRSEDFSKNFKRGRLPDIETVSQKSMEFSKNLKMGKSPDIETIPQKSVEFSKEF